MSMSCAFFRLRHASNSKYLCRASDIAAVGTIFTSLVMMRCRTEILIPDDELMRCVLSHGRRYNIYGNTNLYSYSEFDCLEKIWKETKQHMYLTSRVPSGGDGRCNHAHWQNWERWIHSFTGPSPTLIVYTPLIQPIKQVRKSHPPVHNLD